MVTTDELYNEVKFATHRNLSLNAAAKEACDFMLPAMRDTY
jgi:hypothetical protein